MNQPGTPVTASKSRVAYDMPHGKLGGTTGELYSRPFADGSFLFLMGRCPKPSRKQSLLGRAARCFASPATPVYAPPLRRE